MLGREVKRRGDSLRIIGGVEGDPAFSIADEFIPQSKLLTEEGRRESIENCDSLFFESEFLDLVNEELKNYKRKNPFNVNNCLIKLENKGLLDKFC
jgi:hypothetical protein